MLSISFLMPTGKVTRSPPVKVATKLPMSRILLSTALPFCKASISSSNGPPTRPSETSSSPLSMISELFKILSKYIFISSSLWNGGRSLVSSKLDVAFVLYSPGLTSESSLFWAELFSYKFGIDRSIGLIGKVEIGFTKALSSKTTGRFLLAQSDGANKQKRMVM